MAMLAAVNGPVCGSAVAGTLPARAVYPAGTAGDAEAATDAKPPIAAVMASPRTATALARMGRWCQVMLALHMSQNQPRIRA